MGRLLPNAIIISFLLLQIAAGLKLTCPPKSLPALEPLRIACAPELWPFLEYNMYNGARQPGEMHHAYELFMEFVDGSEALLTHEQAQISYYDLRGRAIKGLIDGHLVRTTGMLGEFLEQRPEIVALRLEADRYRIEDDGTLSQLPRITVTRHPVSGGKVRP